MRVLKASQFKVNTSGNYGEVKRLTEHWERAKMSDEEWHMRVGAKIKEMENEMAALEQKATDLNRQWQKAPSEDTPVWSCKMIKKTHIQGAIANSNRITVMKGINDALASTFNIKSDILRSREMLERDLKDLKRRYDELSDESEQQKQKFSEADGKVFPIRPISDSFPEADENGSIREHQNTPKQYARSLRSFPRGCNGY